MNWITKSGLLLGVTLLAACSTSQPVHNLSNNRVNFTLSEQQVGNAIIDGGLNKGWTMQKVQPGLIRGQLNLRQHQAVIDIPYSAQDYSIKYVRSVNLGDEGKGSIHRNYNRWVQGLDQAIQIELARASSK